MCLFIYSKALILTSDYPLNKEILKVFISLCFVQKYKKEVSQ